MSNFRSTRTLSFRKIVSMITIMSVIAIAGLTFTSTSSFALSGNGQIGTPYLITSCDDLSHVVDNLGAAYQLTATIDCSSEGNDVMVGVQNDVFTGIFDGDSHTITVDIEIVADYTGLFHRLGEDADVKNLTIAGSVIGVWRVGAVAGTANGATVENVTSTADVSGVQYVGGLTGDGSSATITGSSSAGDVTGTDANVGGIVGYVNNVTLSADNTSGSISGDGNVGGIAGYISGQSSITTSFSDADITSTSGNAGGFVGYTFGTGDPETSPTYTDSDATGSVTGTTYVGGFVGESLCSMTYTRAFAHGHVIASDSTAGGFAGFDGCEGPGSTFNQSYATGNVDGTSEVGGFIGHADISTLNQTYATGNVTGSDTLGGLIGRSWGFGYANGESTLVNESYASGSVTADASPAGGLIGLATYTFVQNSYARGAVDAIDSQGGLIGTQDYTEIDNSYSTGQVAQLEIFGGLVGETVHDFDTNYSYWDTQTSGTETSASGEGKTTDAMTSASTFTTDLGENAWDFDAVWGITSELNDGYPCLMWTSEFCVSSAPTSGDSDGISSAIENAGPNSGDANGDGTQDSAQDNVASFVNSVAGDYTTVVVSQGCSLTAVGASTEESKASLDASYSYPKGLVNFSADCGTPGVSITVQEFFFNTGKTASDYVARKYTAYNNTYQTLTGSSLTDVTVGIVKAVKLVFSLTDGGQLDNDQLANGIIIDPAGLGVSPTGTLPATGQNLRSESVVAFLTLMLGCALCLLGRKRYLRA